MDKLTIEKFSEYDLYDLFRIRDSLEMLKTYGLADEDLLVEVKRVIDNKI